MGFALVDTEGRRFEFRTSTDGLDQLLSNLEFLARKALGERMKAGRQPFSPNPTVPPFLTHCDSFQVEEIDATNLTLRLRRQGRNDIEVPIGRQSFDELRLALSSPPTPRGQEN